jgi:hypothetical protein
MSAWNLGKSALKVRCKESIMKERVISIVAVLLFSSSNAFALLGTPMSWHKKDQWSLGFDSTHITQDMKSASSKWVWYGDGAFNSAGKTKVKIEDFTRDLHYANIGYGISDKCQVYLKLGVADLEQELNPGTDLRYFENGKFSSDFDDNFALGAGAKYTYSIDENLIMGANVQTNWLNTSWDTTQSGPTETWKEEIDIEGVEVIAAAGFTVGLGACAVHGGPFLYCFSGEANAKHKTLATTGTFWSGKASWDIESDGFIGGFFGIDFKLRKNFGMTIEYIGTGDGQGIGAGLEIYY